MRNLKNLTGIKTLSKDAQLNIKGGHQWVVTCSFDDGEYWSGSTTSSQVASSMYGRCLNSGGSAIVNWPQK